MDGVNLEISKNYHEVYLQLMIVALNESSALLDENIIAGTVTLRSLEEVDSRPMT
jgi:hypothetical protein